MITILITGCSLHSGDLIKEMRNNYDNEEIRVVGINCDDAALLRKGVDAGYVVPRITEPEYIPTVLDICERENVDVIMPFITAELPIMATYREFFDEHGIKVSVSSIESIEAVGNKTRLAEKYPELMPKQTVAHSIGDILDFAQRIGYPEKSFCCKLPNRCGGLGFCIIDSEKGKDITIVNKFGMNHYITLDQLLAYFENLKETMILQEYEDGTDFSLCILADNGRIVHQLGFEASMMSFGSAMFAKIAMNEQATSIAERITKDSGLDGNACFDFILKQDGSVRLLEVNPRLSATLPFIARAGLNLPYLRCRQLLGYDVDNVKLNINMELRMSKNYETEYFI